MRETGDRRMNPIGNFFIAGLSGSVARAVVNPYSVVKIIGEVGAPGAKTGLVGGFYWLIRSQGWSAPLTKGLTPAVLRAFPHMGIQFAVYNSIISRIDLEKKRRLPLSIDKGISYAPIYIAGGVAASTATLVTHPLDVVKVRTVAMPVSKQPYHGVVDALGKIVEQEGVVRGLYRGLVPSLVGAFAFGGAAFTFWDIGDHLPQRTAPNGKSFVPFEWFLVPCGALIAASVATHPLDVIRRKVMAQSPYLHKNGYVDIRFNNVLECVLNTFKYSGFPGFLFGVFANVSKVIPQLAVFWALSKGMQYGLYGGSKKQQTAKH